MVARTVGRLLHHDHLHTLGTLRNISIGWKIPFRYLRRLALTSPGFPQAYRFPGITNNLTTSDYLYSREAVRAYLEEHLQDLPQDDASGFSSVKEHINKKAVKRGRKRTE